MIDAPRRTSKILALDDEHEILVLLTGALEAEGYRVDTAKTIAEFRERDRTNPPDLYLIDLTLPDGSGLALVRELRSVSDGPS